MNSSERIYYLDSYLQEFDAQVVEIRSLEPGMAALLDRTAFYPESGGQPADQGFIDEAKVLDVQENDHGEVLHFFDGVLSCRLVHCRLDWERRFDHMQQHTGQHLLSGAFAREVKARTLSFHLGREVSTIDLEIADTDAELLGRIEEIAQQMVYRNCPIHVRLHSAEEAQQLPLRKPSARQGELRVVEIQGFDWSACGGTHLGSTGELGSVLIIQADHYKGGTRIQFLCGRRAHRYSAGQRQVLKELAIRLSAPPADLIQAVDRLVEEKGALQRQIRDLRAWIDRVETEQLWNQAASTDPVRVVQAVVEADSPERLKLLAAALIRKGPCLVLLAGQGPAGYALAASSLPQLPDLGKVFSQVLAQYGGRGGGRGTMAQGGGFPPDQSNSLLEDLRRSFLDQNNHV